MPTELLQQLVQMFGPAGAVAGVLFMWLYYERKERAALKLELDAERSASRQREDTYNQRIVAVHNERHAWQAAVSKDHAEAMRGLEHEHTQEIHRMRNLHVAREEEVRRHLQEFAGGVIRAVEQTKLLMEELRRAYGRHS